MREKEGREGEEWGGSEEEEGGRVTIDDTAECCMGVKLYHWERGINVNTRKW